jgi:hypothetical protein
MMTALETPEALIPPQCLPSPPELLLRLLTDY